MSFRAYYHKFKVLLAKKSVIFFENKLVDFENQNSNNRLKLINKNFVNLYKHAFNNSVYLKRKYEKSGLNINSIKDINDIEKIPFLTREEIIEHKDDILTVKKTKNIGKSTTGGTTGFPMSYYRDNNLPYESFYSFYLKEWGLKPSDNSVYIWRKKEVSFFGNLINYFFWFPTKKLKFDGTTLNKKEVFKIVSLLNKYKPPLIQGYAGCIFQLSKIISDEGLSLNYRPKAVWVTAAPLTFNERKHIGKIFKSNVYNEYGSAEIPWIAFQKEPNIDLLYVNNFSRHLEIIDPNNEGLGDISLTDFFDFSFPKIRYLNGDRARFSNLSTTDRTIIEPVFGRESDYLLVPIVGKIDGSYLTTVFNNYPNAVKGFQFVQNSIDEIQLLVIPNYKNIDYKTDVNFVLGDLNKKFEGKINLKLLIVDELLIDRGKMKYVIRSFD